MRFHLVCLNWLICKLFQREILLIGSSLRIPYTSRAHSLINLRTIDSCLFSFHSLWILVSSWRGCVVSCRITRTTLIIETRISCITTNISLSRLIFFLAYISLIHLNSVIWMSVNSSTSYPLGLSTWSFWNILFHSITLTVVLISHHLIHNVIVPSCWIKMRLLNSLSSTLLRYLNSFLRNCSAETIFTVNVPWLRVVIPITLSSLSILTTICMSSTSRLSFGLKLTDLLNLVLHVDHWILRNTFIHHTILMICISHWLIWDHASKSKTFISLLFFSCNCIFGWV